MERTAGIVRPVFIDCNLVIPSHASYFILLDRTVLSYFILLDRTVLSYLCSHAHIQTRAIMLYTPFFCAAAAGQLLRATSPAHRRPFLHAPHKFGTECVVAAAAAAAADAAAAAAAAKQVFIMTS